MQHQALKQAPAAHPLQHLGVTRDEILESLLQLLPTFLHIAQQPPALNFMRHGQSSCAGKGVAAEGAGVITGLEHIRCGVHQQGTDGMAASQSLGQGEGVRFDAELLVAPEPTAAAHAHLHLIKDQQDVALAAVLAQALEEAGITGVNPPFTLQRFKQHGRHRRSVGFMAFEQRLEGMDVVVREVIEALNHRFEALVVARLAGGAHGCQGAAMEAG